jgi:SAM-dependent methyltransferase
MSSFGRLRAVFRAVLPFRFRRWFWQRDWPLTRWLIRAKGRLAASAAFDEIYDVEYFAGIAYGMAASADVLAESIVDAFRPAAVADVGCGPGLLLAALRDRGASGVGFDHAEAALARCQAQGLDARPIDLIAADELPVRADVVISTEVAEHLPTTAAARFVGLLCRAAPVVVFTAAVPGQGGTEHLNEQPNEYWIDLFNRRGFRHRTDLTERWRREWAAAGVHPWYARNVMVFSALDGPSR